MITTFTKDAGSLLAYHPIQSPAEYETEKTFKKACCRIDCRFFFDRRPINDGTGYEEPVGGILCVFILALNEATFQNCSEC